jgi:HEPN domain-containing protein
MTQRAGDSLSTASEIAERWLSTARADLLAARDCLEGPHLLPGIAAYHCQQAAEKLVKALLIYRGVAPPRSHDIDALAHSLAPDDRQRFGLAELGRLTPYAIAFRYPGEDTDPEFPDAAEIASWVIDIETRISQAEQDIRQDP